MSTRTAIIGAGASGLSLALLLDGDVEVFEMSDEPGGHASTTVRDGWTFDRGPHIMFSKDAAVLDFMIRSLAGNVHQSRRNSRVCIDGHFAKYPIENDLAALPADLRNDCLLSFLFNEHADLDPSNLYEWFLKTFGRGLTDLYLVPYNEKVWKVPVADLSMIWSERIPQPPPIDVVRGALGISTEGYVHQLHFHYPRVGGYQAIPLAWSRLLPPDQLHLGSRVDGIRFPPAGGVELSLDGRWSAFDRVVSTVPLPALPRLLADPMPEAVQAATQALQINPMIVATLGFRGVDPHEFSSVYFPDTEFLVNRISAPCTFSPENGPPGCFSIQADITAGPDDPVMAMSDEAVTQHVLEGLRANGVVLASHELVFVDIARFEYAYIVYRVGYEQHLATVRDWCEQRGLFLHGRFGAFEYLNVDGCVIRSIELAGRLNRRETSLDEIELPEPELETIDG